ncbi:MAG: peptidoglycan-binding domain-containing protein [Minisyncoccia bacterium]
MEPSQSKIIGGGNVYRVLFLILLLFSNFFFIGIDAAKADVGTGQIQLTNDGTNYTVENEYYRAVIPAAGQTASGIVRFLYIKKADGSWSNNLIDNANYGSAGYGLGYLEGKGDATSNDSIGLSGNATINVQLNSSTTVQIHSTGTIGGVSYSEIWTFWAAKPYFQSDASAVRTGSGVLSNQFQFCDMINRNLTTNQFLVDQTGSIVPVSTRVYQQINSPELNVFPWHNWQFPTESVSLGAIFTNVDDNGDHLGIVDETGDQPFEYQLDFELGGGYMGSPVNTGDTRSATTIYYTANQATNTNIASFAQASYQNATSTVTSNSSFQAAQFINNPLGQASSTGSALLNAPYFLVRQNSENSSVFRSAYPQYQTSVYGPLYGTLQAAHAGVEDYQDKLQFSLNYDNNSTTYTYGTTTASNAINGPSTSIQYAATSSDGIVSYNSVFTTWNDSDKLDIAGTASNATSSSSIKDIYLQIASEVATTTFNAVSALPTSSITGTLGTSDNLWTTYNGYGYPSLIYRDNQEHVPPVAIPITLPNNTYHVIASVQQRAEGAITYQYSTDGITYIPFTVPQGSVTAPYTVDLGTMSVNGQFWIEDDGSASTGINGWAGWNSVTIGSGIISLGSNVYDMPLTDPMYGQMGIAFKINSPAVANVTYAGSNLDLFLYSSSTAQTLGTFNYPFDITIWPHKGWLASASEFTPLHSQASLTYDKRTPYIPNGIHLGRSNSIYTGGAISYSADPYSSATIVNMTITPLQGIASTTINTWTTASKIWTEADTVSTDRVVHTVGDLSPNTNYQFKLDGVASTTAISGGSCVNGICLSDSSGSLTFTYLGGYSTHTFELDTYPPPTPITTSNSAVQSSPGAISPIYNLAVPLMQNPLPVATVTSTTPVSTPLPSGVQTALQTGNSYTFLKNLQYRSTNVDVLQLQKYLNAHGFVLAQSGAGSPRNETNYFGTKLYAALVKFQKSNGLPATGYFGPLTRAVVNK